MGVAPRGRLRRTISGEQSSGDSKDRGAYSIKGLYCCPFLGRSTQFWESKRCPAHRGTLRVMTKVVVPICCKLRRAGADDLGLISPSEKPSLDRTVVVECEMGSLP